MAVALRKESVDRNFFGTSIVQKRTPVALRKESVDRNLKCCFVILLAVVALRKESVDRNFTTRTRTPIGCVSLSARRAWIEIPIVPVELTTLVKSLSARRAWIEIDAIAVQAYNGSGRSPQGERG